jgi:zinc protease
MAVVGDVAPDDVTARFGDAFDGWIGDGIGLIEDSASDSREPAEERLQIPDRPNLDVFLGHRSSVLRGDGDFAASMIANACLGQSTLTSRLGLAVRDEAGLTYGIYSRFFGTMHIAGPWATYLSVSADNLDRAIKMCREVIADYASDGPTEDELSDERLAQAGSYRVGLATNGGVARELVALLTAGQSVDHLDRYPDRILSLTRDEVMAAIQKHLHPDRIVVTAAGTIE